MRPLVLLLAAALAAEACAQCELKHCNADLTLHLRDADGAPVTKFFGRVTLDGRRTADFSCEGAPKVTDEFACESGGDLRLPGMAQEQGNYAVHLTDAASGAIYDGGLTPAVTSIPDFNGEGCGGCPTGEATVSFPKP